MYLKKKNYIRVRSALSRQWFLCDRENPGVWEQRGVPRPPADVKEPTARQPPIQTGQRQSPARILSSKYPPAIELENNSYDQIFSYRNRFMCVQD